MQTTKDMQAQMLQHFDISLAAGDNQTVPFSPDQLMVDQQSAMEDAQVNNLTPTQQLIQRLNLHDKGSDCVILHPGSHSLKFGLASQYEPFVTPMVVAHPVKVKHL